jgi:alkylhydroperoxidase family enzyme
MSEVTRYEESERFTPREKLALAYADTIIWNPDRADDALWERLHAEFTDRLLDRFHLRRAALAYDSQDQEG